MVKAFVSKISNGGKSPVRFWLVMAAPIILVLTGVFYYVHGSRYVGTENAYVKADKISISTEVSGRIVEVAVSENQKIEKGQLLFRIDDLPFRIARDKAEAAVRNSVNDFGALKARYRQKQAELKGAQYDAAYFNTEFQRQSSLAFRSIASRAKLDQARHEYQAAREEQDKIGQELQEIVAQLDGNPGLSIENYPPYKAALAGLEKANLDLSHTVLSAPAAGVVSKTGNLQVGNYAFAGSPSLSLVKVDYLWIEANMKETDITHVVVGQKATAEIDTYSDQPFKAVVTSVAPATGAEFAILPPQNATGNWVKVVQRVPVRLQLENEQDKAVLRAGMSVTISIDTGEYYALPKPLRSFFGGGSKDS